MAEDEPNDRMTGPLPLACQLAAAAFSTSVKDAAAKTVTGCSAAAVPANVKVAAMPASTTRRENAKKPWIMTIPLFVVILRWIYRFAAMSARQGALPGYFEG